MDTREYRAAAAYGAAGEPDDFAEKEEPTVCGVVPILTAGFLTCSVVIAEGLFLLLNMDAAVPGANVGIVGMDSRNPYHHAQKIVLIVVGLVDCVMAAAGIVGLWLASGPPLELLGPRLQGNLPAFGVGVLLAWRALITVATAPWLGFIMAFEPDDYPEGQCLLVALIYIALNIYMLWLLVKLRSEVLRLGAYLQQALLDVVAERTSLAPYPDSQPLARRPTLFWCLPLEATVAAYSLVVCVACAWSFVTLCTSGSSRGGWAVVTSAAVHEPGGALWLEALVYLVPAVFAGLALSAILTHTQLQEQETGSRARCSLLMLLFLMASVVRYAAFIPITALQLAETDICGFYIYGLSRLSSHTAVSAASTHCSSSELLTVAAVVVFLALDAYLISGVFRLWQAYHEGQLFMGSHRKGLSYLDYGASQVPS